MIELYISVDIDAQTCRLATLTIPSKRALGHNVTPTLATFILREVVRNDLLHQADIQLSGNPALYKRYQGAF